MDKRQVSTLPHLLSSSVQNKCLALQSHASNFLSDNWKANYWSVHFSPPTHKKKSCVLYKENLSTTAKRSFNSKIKHGAETKDTCLHFFFFIVCCFMWIRGSSHAWQLSAAAALGTAAAAGQLNRRNDNRVELVHVDKGQIGVGSGLAAWHWLLKRGREQGTTADHIHKAEKDCCLFD